MSAIWKRFREYYRKISEKQKTGSYSKKLRILTVENA